MVIAFGIFAALLALGLLGPVYRPRCPDCGHHASREITCGVPVWVCVREEHLDPDGEPTVIGIGLLSRLVGPVLPFTGWMFVARPGREAYLLALWDWWRAMGGRCDCGEEHR